MDAEQCKERGNSWFKSKQYANAIDEYTLAIGLCDTDPIIYRNRAQAYLNLGLYDNAIDDCNMAINHILAKNSLSEYHLLNLKQKEDVEFLKLLVKTYFRCATAYFEKGDLPMAYKKFKIVSLLDPTNSIAQNFIQQNGSKYEKSFLSESSKNILSTRKDFTNFYQLSKDLHQLQKLYEENPNDPTLFMYVSKIDPFKYPHIFKDTLEYTHFYTLLSIFHSFVCSKNQNCNINILDHLECLGKIKRFTSIIKLFLEKEDKIKLHVIINYYDNKIQANDGDTQYKSQIEKIVHLYNL